MNNGTDNHLTTIDVGERLRILREERDLSMRSLARASGLSTNALSMIERGKTSPSVSTLVKLAGALGTPVTTFFRSEPTRSNIVFCKASQRKKVDIPAGLFEGLGGDAFSGTMEPIILTLEPGSSSGEHDMIHSGQEFALCLEGVVEYGLEHRLFRMEAGDSLIFAANLKHSWHNPGDKLAKVLIVLASFEQGERPSEFHLAAAHVEADE